MQTKDTNPLGLMVSLTGESHWCPGGAAAAGDHSSFNFLPAPLIHLHHVSERLHTASLPGTLRLLSI